MVVLSIGIGIIVMTNTTGHLNFIGQSIFQESSVCGCLMTSFSLYFSTEILELLAAKEFPIVGNGKYLKYFFSQLGEFTFLIKILVFEEDRNTSFSH